MAAEPTSDLKFEIGHVLLIDIVGYSKLLINEERERLQELNEIVRNTAQFRASDTSGMLMRIPTGDGMALIFRDSLESPVRCALEISGALKNHPDLQVRMGIHSGPVSEVSDVNERANIAGAGINVAQRVMDCGDAGHILLSKRVADDLAQYRHWKAHLHDLGDCEVKHGERLGIVNLYSDGLGNPNMPEKLRADGAGAPSRRGNLYGPGAGRLQALIRRPMLLTGAVVLALVLSVGALLFLPRLQVWFLDRPVSSNPQQIESIAVLPFENKSADANTEYLSDGISEALINSLTELQQLRVIARSTAFRYKGRDFDPQTVGRELKVRAVLTGRVRQMGDKLNILVDLVDASTGAQLWGEEYERTVSDVLPIKQAIAREVTEKLRLKLSGEQQRQLVKRDTSNAEAYQFYLRGRYYWNKRTVEGIQKALEQFQQAIVKDPNYALAYVGLADCYLISEQYAGTPTSETVPKAKPAAERALQLDGSLAEAHTSLAFYYDRSWQWGEAEKEFKRAITLNPNYPTARHWYSMYLRAVGRRDEAMAEIKRAQELDPLSPVISVNVAMLYLLKGEFDATAEECKRTIELYPNYPDGYRTLAMAYVKQGRSPEAIAEMNKAVELSGRTSEYLGPQGYCYAVAGGRSEAVAILRELEAKYGRRESTAAYLAMVYAGLGDKDQAFAWLEKDFQARSGTLGELTWRPYFDSLRGDARYADLLRRMGL